MRYREINEAPLMELSGVKKWGDYTASQLLVRLQEIFGSDKAELLGMGSLGAALKFGDTVVKMWVTDNSYESFVYYAKAHQSNPFMPKFKSEIKQLSAFFQRSIESPDKVSYVKVELLKEFTGSYNFKLNLPQDVKDHPNYDSSLDSMRLATVLLWWSRTHERVKLDNDRMKMFTEFLERLSFQFGMNFDEVGMHVDHLGDELVLFMNTIFDLITLDMFSKLDLHEGNFMMRGKQLVIIDPLANMEDLRLNKRLRDFDYALLRAKEKEHPIPQHKVGRKGELVGTPQEPTKVLTGQEGIKHLEKMMFGDKN